MKPAAFEYHRPESVDQVVALLAQFDGEAQIIAGGQSLTPMLSFRMSRPAHLIDVNALTSLDCIRVIDGVLEIGALTRHHRIATDPLVHAHCPLLAEAAGTIGHYAIRQRGTIGGSLAHADPSAQLPLITTLLNAEIVLAGRNGQRAVPARGFFLGSLDTAIEPGEIIVCVRIRIPAVDAGWSFELFSQRRGDFAIVAVAVLLLLGETGKVERLSIAIAGIGPTPLSMDNVSQASLGRMPDAAWQSELVTTLGDSLEPDDNPKFPALYRKDLARNLLTRALASALSRAERSRA